MSGRRRLDLILALRPHQRDARSWASCCMQGNSEVELRTNRVRLQQRLTQALRHPRFADYDVVLIDCPRTRDEARAGREWILPTPARAELPVHHRAEISVRELRSVG